jgi:pilus assembly protein Flp/PilA
LAAAADEIGANPGGGNIVTSMMNKLIRDESGATAIEYGLIAALIAVVIIVAIQAVGTNLSSTFNTVATSL